MAALSKMKKLDKKKKPKQKQKQKQTVRTSVKVNVQSSGGSGGGGVSQGGGMPSYIPNAFNQEKLVGLLEQISQKVAVRQNVPVPSGMPISQSVEPPVENPANDNTTLKAVFNSPINFDTPLNVGGVSKLEEPLPPQYPPPPPPKEEIPPPKEEIPPPKIKKNEIDYNQLSKGQKASLKKANKELQENGYINLLNYTKPTRDILFNFYEGAHFISEKVPKRNSYTKMGGEIKPL